jgi:hypothetical protein
MPKAYVSNSDTCQQSVFVDCMAKVVSASGFTEVPVEATAITESGALLANKHYPLRGITSTVVALTLPATPAIGDTIVLDTIQGITPYTIGGTVLSIAAPTGQAIYILKWNGSKWVVSNSRPSFTCPGDNK